MFAAAKGRDVYRGGRNPASISKFIESTPLTITVGSDGSITCGDYSDRWWTAGATPPTCYATYGISANSAGQPAYPTTMSASPDRTSTASGPTVTCDAGILEGTIAIYSSASGGTLVASVGFALESSYP